MAVRLLILTLVLFWADPALKAEVPVDPDALEDPVAELRARGLMKQIRCLVCQNQSIEDSNATIAISLRALVREKIAAGETDDQIKSFLVDRYGDWVMLKPPVDTRTFFLWGSPFLLLLIGGAAVVANRRQTSTSHPPTAQDLSAEEEAELKKLLGPDS